MADDFNVAYVNWHNTKSTRYGQQLNNLIRNLRGAKLVAPQSPTHAQPHEVHSQFSLPSFFQRGNERNANERTAELAGQQSDSETSWRRSGTNGGRNRKESIAKRDHGRAGEVTVRTDPVSNSGREFDVVNV
ncbi:hypothetical protein TNCV_2065711 [Trichonephila clavipes]|nr:hypothetical protein TNCV_2065711 [Trichonephila clavipes]